MPRQRMVKPEFFDSESLGACSIAARLCFIGLWVIGDDYGNQKLQPSRMRMKLFPYDEMDDAAFLAILDELEQAGCIKCYERDGERFLNIPNFAVYQTVRKPSASNIPEPQESVKKAKRTRKLMEWRTSASLVRHQCATSADKERKKEGRNEVFTDFIPNESASDGAEAAEAAPPSAPICPTCASPLRFSVGDGGIRWRCRMCGEVDEPAYGIPKEAS